MRITVETICSGGLGAKPPGKEKGSSQMNYIWMHNMKYVSEKCRLTRGGILFPPNLNSEKYPLSRGDFIYPGFFIKQEKVYIYIMNPANYRPYDIAAGSGHLRAVFS